MSNRCRQVNKEPHSSSNKNLLLSDKNLHPWKKRQTKKGTPTVHTVRFVTGSSFVYKSNNNKYKCVINHTWHVTDACNYIILLSHHSSLPYLVTLPLKLLITGLILLFHKNDECTAYKNAVVCAMCAVMDTGQAVGVGTNW